VAIFPASAFRTSNAEVAVMADSAVTALAMEDLAVVIASVEVRLAEEAALADSEAVAGSAAAVVGSGAGDNNLGLGFPRNFFYKQK
jgi:hypothetical protein